jgi:hypothetical protein
MHMTRSDFEVYQPIDNGYVAMGDGSEVPALGRGTIVFTVDGHSVRLKDVLHVPALDVTLISIRVHHRRRGCGFIVNEEGMFLTFPTFRVHVDDTIYGI